MSDKRMPVLMDIRIPYCIQPENFCTRIQLVGSNPEKNAYLAAVKRELLSYEGTLDDYEIAAVRLSGPNSTVMSPDLLGDLLATVRKQFTVARGAEFSVDAHPLTIGTPALTGISAGRPTRFDLMMRSASDEELHVLGCTHTMQHVNNAILFFNRFRLNNLALTVNYGIPSQTDKSWQNTLHACTIIHPAHISVLPIEVTDAEGMPSAQQRAAMYAQACEYLQANGYLHYGKGLFCLPQHGHMFELLRTEGVPVIGLGLGAVTSFEGYVTRNTTNARIYISHAGDYQKTTAQVFEMDAHYQMQEYAQLRMRSAEGLKTQIFTQKFGTDLPEDIKKALDAQVHEGLAEATDDGYKPTITGFAG